MKKDEKKTKKPGQNKKIPKLPGGQNVKIIEISLSKLVMPLLLLIVTASVFWTYNNATSEKIKINDSVGLNQIIAQYNSGTYEEIIIQGQTVKALYPKRQNVVNNKIEEVRDIDQTSIPTNLEITDIGLSNPENLTKVTIQEEGWGKQFFADLLPSIVGVIIFVVLIFFLMGRMGGGGMGGPMAFIRSRARVYDPELDEKVTFADVAGSDEEK
jgi:cell division protease FtsH